VLSNILAFLVHVVVDNFSMSITCSSNATLGIRIALAAIYKVHPIPFLSFFLLFLYI